MDRPIKVPQTDPKAGYLAHQAEIDAAIQRVLNSGWYILGQEVESFEQEFAAYIGVHHAIGVGNGTEALELSLRACAVGPGDLVFTVSHTAVATVAAIELVGATPVLVDIDPVTYTMDPNCLEDALAHPPAGIPKAIIPVHLYGHPADIPSILALAKRHGLFVIEDCAQSHGASLQGRKTGSWGHMSAFSFYPTKNLGALGDGGMVVTNDSYMAERVGLLHQYGWRDRYISEITGINSRLDELQAAILRVKLRYLEQENERRRKIAQIYTDNLIKTQLILPVGHAWEHRAYHQYVISTERRDDLRKYLQKNGVDTLIHYPQPIHLQPAYRNKLNVNPSLKCTEEASRKILSLPIFPELSDEHILYVTKTILDWAKLC